MVALEKNCARMPAPRGASIHQIHAAGGLGLGGSTTMVMVLFVRWFVFFCVVSDSWLITQTYPIYNLEVLQSVPACTIPYTYHSSRQVGPRPQIWEFWVTWGVKSMQLHHVWGWHPPHTTSQFHIRYIHSIWAFGMLSQGHMGAPSYHSTGQVGPKFGNSLGHLRSENDANTSCLRLTSTSDHFPISS